MKFVGDSRRNCFTANFLISQQNTLKILRFASAQKFIRARRNFARYFLFATKINWCASLACPRKYNQINEKNAPPAAPDCEGLNEMRATDSFALDSRLSRTRTFEMITGTHRARCHLVALRRTMIPVHDDSEQDGRRCSGRRDGAC